MQTEEFEELLKSFLDLFDTSRGRRDKHFWRLQADTFLIRHPDTSAGKMRQFLTYSVQDARTAHYYVGAARIAVHCYRHLSQSDQDVLNLSADPEIPWYVRQECLLALTLPLGRFNWEDVKDILGDNSLGNEIRVAALELIVAHQKRDLIAFLRDFGETIDQKNYFAQELSRKISLARLRLTDLTMVVPVLRLLISPWSIDASEAKNALEDAQTACGGPEYIASYLVNSMEQEASKGQTNIWLQLQRHQEPAVRIWALKHAPSGPKQHQNCLDLLTADDWLVQKAASDWLIEKKIGSWPIAGNVRRSKCEYRRPQLGGHDLYSPWWRCETIRGTKCSSKQSIFG